MEPHTFWVNPFGVPWPSLRARDLIRVGEGGKVIEGGDVKLLNTAAYMIHHAGRCLWLRDMLDIYRVFSSFA